MLLYPQHTGREDYFAVGCWQDKIVLQHSAGYQQQPLNPAGEAATDEELRAWLAADEQARNEQTKNICLLDTAGSMTARPDMGRQ